VLGLLKLESLAPANLVLALLDGVKEVGLALRLALKLTCVSVRILGCLVSNAVKQQGVFDMTLVYLFW
jgi:hypothetical protein